MSAATPTPNVGLCRKCYREAETQQRLNVVRQLASTGEWVCPWSDPICGQALDKHGHPQGGAGAAKSE